MCADGLPEQACQEAVAIELGRDLLRLGIDPFITRLVGDDNAQRLWERHAYGDGDDDHRCPYTHAHTRHWCGYERCRDS